MNKKKLTTFINIYYPVTDEAKAFYKKIEDRNLVFINGGSSLFPTQDQWLKENARPDSTGDSISKLNSKVNEWTALYWIRHHLDMFDSEYIAFNHYRLFFKDIPQSLDKDIYCKAPLRMAFSDPYTGQPWSPTIEQSYKICHIPSLWEHIENVIVSSGFTDKQTLFSWKNQIEFNAPCMMMMLKRQHFMSMFDSCWPIVKWFADRLQLEKVGYYQRRQCAFIGERLFSLWCYIQKRAGLSVSELQTEKHDSFKPFTDIQERQMA